MMNIWSWRMLVGTKPHEETQRFIVRNTSFQPESSDNFGRVLGFGIVIG